MPVAYHALVSSNFNNSIIYLNTIIINNKAET